jgi:2-polyprenyl-6-hydroxyphenyl methylase/3-demethylubiquinone-9 3-methyltransferase
MSIVSTVSRALGRRRGGGGGSARRFLLSSLSYRISSNVDDDINIIHNSRRSASTSTSTTTTTSKKSQTSTVDTRETKKFEQDAQLWWRERDGPFGPLHSMNPARCSFIRDECVEHFFSSSNKSDDDNAKERRGRRMHGVDNKISFVKPLSGLRILDVGCGGGLLSESLSRLGAQVVGLDAGKENVEAAKRRQRESQLGEEDGDEDSDDTKVKYICDTAEDLGEKEPHSFDVVCALEVIEHVTDPRVFASALRKLVKDDGLVFVSTISKSMRGVLGAIVFAERVARMVPAGTHDPNKFLHPSELAIVLERAGLKTNTMAGMEYNLLTKQWKLTDDLGINYIASATVGTFEEDLPLAQEDVHDKRYQD